MTTPLSVFIPEVAVEVPECPQVLIEHHAVRAIARFCKETRRLRETLAPIDIVAGTSEYAVVPSSNLLKVVRVEAVWVDGELLYPVTEAELDAEIPEWRTEAGPPSLYAWIDEKIRLYPTPESASTDGLVVRISYTLDLTKQHTSFESLLYQEYGDGLASGIKARLMAIPKKAWSEPKLALFHENAFRVAVAQAKMDGAGGLTKTRLRTKVYS